MMLFIASETGIGFLFATGKIVPPLNYQKINTFQFTFLFKFVIIFLNYRKDVDFMKVSYEYYHRSGNKVTITDIPEEFNEKGVWTLRIMHSLQKQIDEIDHMYQPKRTYRLKLEETG
jgi:hypothetical protein